LSDRRGEPTLSAMKTRIFKLCLATIAATLLVMSQSFAADESGPYRHVVFFKFKESATPAQVKHIEEEFAKLPSKMDFITGFEWGTNVSPENLNDGFTHCFLVTFKDKAGVDAYLPHPAHQAFVAILKPLLDKVCVVDYVARK
jgi:quinol monooxygenase YgiN